MKRVLEFQSSMESYHCDAIVVACFDNRFDRVLRRFLRHIHVVNPDPVLVAGGAKSLSSPEHPADRNFLLAQVEKSIRLHNTTRAILSLHSDCGAYGGLGAFKDNEAAEVAHFRDELRHSRRIMHDLFPTLEIECYFFDFRGVWQLFTPGEPDHQAHPHHVPHHS
jgi:hypothetical protein